MKVLSIAKMSDESVVKVRWRIVSKGKWFAFLKFWKFKEMRTLEHWNDGIVRFDLNVQGKVKKITIDKARFLNLNLEI